MTITNDQLTQWLAENPTASPTDVATAAVAAGVPAAQVAEVLTQTNFFNGAVSTATVNAAYAAVTPTPTPAPILELEPPEPPPPPPPPPIPALTSTQQTINSYVTAVINDTTLTAQQQADKIAAAAVSTKISLTDISGAIIANASINGQTITPAQVTSYFTQAGYNSSLAKISAGNTSTAGNVVVNGTGNIIANSPVSIASQTLTDSLGKSFFNSLAANTKSTGSFDVTTAEIVGNSGLAGFSFKFSDGTNVNLTLSGQVVPGQTLPSYLKNVTAISAGSVGGNNGMTFTYSDQSAVFVAQSGNAIGQTTLLPAPTAPGTVSTASAVLPTVGATGYGVKVLAQLNTSTTAGVIDQQISVPGGMAYLDNTGKVVSFVDSTGKLVSNPSLKSLQVGSDGTAKLIYNDGSSIIADSSGKVVSTISSTGNVISTAANGSVTTSKVSTTGNTVSTTGSTNNGVILNGVNNVVSTVGSAVGTLTNAAGAVTGTLTNAVGSVTGAVTNAVGSVTGAVTGALGVAASAAAAAAAIGTVANLLKNASTDPSNLISNAGNTAAAALQNAFNSIKSAATPPTASDAEVAAQAKLKAAFSGPTVPAPDPYSVSSGAATKAQLAAAQANSSLASVNGDWRVKLSLAPGSTYLYNADSAGILTPLLQTNGIIFPYTPSIQTSYQASYQPYDLTHSNYRGYFYTGSHTGDIQITATFTAQDNTEAAYMLAVIHFLKSATKMFYGGGGGNPDPQLGSPPPLCFLTGLGDYQFNNHACVVSNFTYNLPADVDYIRAYSSTPPTIAADAAATAAKNSPASLISKISATLARLEGANLAQGGKSITDPGNNVTAIKTLGTSTDGSQPTYIPTKMEITITLLPMQSRRQVSQDFSLRDYGNGSLLKGGFW